jgi:hypothetical protein
MNRCGRSFEQLRFLRTEVRVLIGSKWWRVGMLPFSPAMWVLVQCRVDRVLFLLFGRAWAGLRLLFFPLFLLFRVLGPVRLGNRVTVGAGAVVVRDAGDGEVLIGVPARPVRADAAITA